MDDLTLHVEEPQGRLDRFLADSLPALSRSTVQRLIREGKVTVNEAPAKASYCPIPGDEVRIVWLADRPQPPAPEAIPLTVLYEDDYLLVIDKPAGLVVHPAQGHVSGTLVNALLAHRPGLLASGLNPERPGIVHRLDRDTSGVMIVAATLEVQAALQAQFKARKVYKTYLALVHGRLVPEQGAIEAPIGRDPRDRTRRAVVAEGGRYARTAYQVREYLPETTLIEAHPLTGRTHQLRVHLASIGHPVVGDAIYGFRREHITSPRQFLHAWRIAFTHPISGEAMEFTSELPHDWPRSCSGCATRPEPRSPGYLTCFPEWPRLGRSQISQIGPIRE
ncbi:MAG: RluA family pseudouridine synthase [Anaerolineae bacterium]